MNSTSISHEESSTVLHKLYVANTPYYDILVRLVSKKREAGKVMDTHALNTAL